MVQAQGPRQGPRQAARSASTAVAASFPPLGVCACCTGRDPVSIDARRAGDPPPGSRPVNETLIDSSQFLRQPGRPGPRTSGRSMRSLLATVTLAVLLGASAAQAEKRIFIVANNADGYGIDRCLASGARCGTAAATAYCKSRAFAQAVSFRKVDKDEITGAIPADSRGLPRRQLRAVRRHRVHALSAAAPAATSSSAAIVACRIRRRSFLRSLWPARSPPAAPRDRRCDWRGSAPVGCRARRRRPPTVRGAPRPGRR